MIKSNRHSYIFFMILLVGTILLSAKVKNCHADTTDKFFELLNYTPKVTPATEIYSLFLDKQDDFTGIAVFHRGKYHWIVSDFYQDLDLETIKKQAENFIDEIVILPNSQALIIRLKIKDNISILARKGLYKWQISFSRQPLPFAIKNYWPKVGTPATSISFTQIHDANIVSFIDPEIGDTIMIATEIEPGIGFINGYKFIDFEILPSLQGLALISNSDDIFMESSSKELQIKTHRPKLNISDYWQELIETEINKSSPLNNRSLYEFIASTASGQSFNHQEKELIINILNSPAEYKNSARIELAGYYLYMGLGTNALPILSRVYNHTSLTEEKNKLSQLMGIANFLAGRYETARQNFGNHAVNPQEAEFWQAALTTLLDPSKENFANLKPKLSLLTKYPSILRSAIAKSLIPAIINYADHITVTQLINLADENPANSEDVKYYTALNLFNQNHQAEAVKLFEALTRSKSLKYAAFARKQIIDIKYANHKAELDEIINEYEKLQYAWPESSFKAELLKRLAEFYEQKKDWSSTLAALQKSLPLVPGTNKSVIVDKMVKIFDIFYSEKLSLNDYSFKDLAFYYDYQWLAKTNPKYHQISIEIIKRLINLGLVNRAEKLAQEVLTNENLTSLEQEQITNYLALAQVLLNQPELSLEILNQNRNQDLTPKIKLQQLIITANAILILGEQRDLIALSPNKKEVLTEILNSIKTEENNLNHPNIDLGLANDYDLIQSIKKYKQKLINGIY